MGWFPWQIDINTAPWYPPPRMAAPKFHFRSKSCQKPWPSVALLSTEQHVALTYPTSHQQNTIPELVLWRVQSNRPLVCMENQHFSFVDISRMLPWDTVSVHGPMNHQNVTSPASRSGNRYIFFVTSNIEQLNDCSGKCSRNVARLRNHKVSLPVEVWTDKWMRKKTINILFKTWKRQS